MDKESPVQSRQEPQERQISPNDVRAYLAANPGFLVENPDLLRTLTPPRYQTGSNVVDFQSFVVSNLQTALARADSLRDDLIAASRSNLASQQQVHMAVLAALDALDFDHFVHTVTGDWVDMLGLDAVALAVEAPVSDQYRNSHNLRLLASGYIDALMGRDQAVVLRGGVLEASDVFGPAASLVRAEALVRVPPGRISPPALLAMGSRDPAAFAPGQGTELVRFLAAVVQRGLDRWLGAGK
ncbi:MAG: DUF484 family protein [Alphaproteobacteria bacterium]|nr:MAG: DUF484 family protein [Alphaproteobacteria bacterium]